MPPTLAPKEVYCRGINVSPVDLIKPLGFSNLISDQFLTSLLEDCLRGHLRAAGGRLPHIVLVVLTYWGALRLWGIAVPLAQGLAMVPLVLLIGALPITPAGLGTSQATLVLLFSPYVPLPHSEVRAAAVLAFGLIYYFWGIVAQALLGLWCWVKLRHIC